MLGRATNVNPIAAMFPDGWGSQVVHVLLSCYAATGFAVAGIHAFGLLRDRQNSFHRAALGIALRTYGFTLTRVAGDSMAETLVAGDIALVTKFDYLRAAPARGDLVELALPGRDGRYLKRGLPDLDIR